MKRPFFIFHFVALLVLISWFFPMTRVLWDSVDEKAFYFFNGLLRSMKISIIIGILSQHLTDFLFDFLMIALFFKVLLDFYKKDKLKSFSMLLSCLAYEFFMFYAVNKKLIPKYFASGRLSPSYLFDEVRTVMDKVDISGVKLGAVNCFPGDHATSFLLGFLFILFFKPTFRQMCFGLILTLLASLPRLFIAAHWLTDIFVGSVFVSLVLFAWAMYTPLLNFMHTNVEKFFTKSLSFFSRWQKTE